MPRNLSRMALAIQDLKRLKLWNSAICVMCESERGINTSHDDDDAIDNINASKVE